MYPMRELNEMELDAVCGGEFNIAAFISQRNKAVVVNSAFVSIRQTNSIEQEN
jgi:hypothetical protein